MSAAETILKTVFTVLSADNTIDVEVDNRGLGMAYAVPAGTAATAVDDYSPWSDAEVRQVFYRQSALGSTMAEVQLVLSWQYSGAQQYIVNVSVDKNATVAPSVKVGVRVSFFQPTPYTDDLEAYRIPFTVDVTFTPLFGSETVSSKGYLQADGTGSFPPFPDPTI